MKQLTFNVPEEVSEYEVKMTVASLLFDRGIFSSGQAAEFVGISKRDFIEKIGSFGVSIFGETTNDLKLIHE